MLGLAVGGGLAVPLKPAQAFPFGGGDEVASGLDEVAKGRAKVEEGTYRIPYTGGSGLTD